MFVSSEVVVGARLASRAYKAHDSLSSIGNVQYFLRYIYGNQAKKNPTSYETLSHTSQ